MVGETAGELLQKFPRTPSKLLGFGEGAGLVRPAPFGVGVRTVGGGGRVWCRRQPRCGFPGLSRENGRFVPQDSGTMFLKGVKPAVVGPSKIGRAAGAVVAVVAGAEIGAARHILPALSPAGGDGFLLRPGPPPFLGTGPAACWPGDASRPVLKRLV